MLIRTVIPWSVLVAALMFGSCRHAAPDVPEVGRSGEAATQPSASGQDAPANDVPTAQLEERWIGAGAGSGGMGTREQPYGSIEEALAAGGGKALHLRLLPGTYVGTWELPAGTVLEGGSGQEPPAWTVLEGGPGEARPTGAVVKGGPETRLEAPEGSSTPLLQTVGEVTLKGLTLVGGSPTLRGEGLWMLEDVEIRSSACLALREEGGVSARRVSFVATAAAGTCLDLAGNSAAALIGSNFEGPWRIGLAISDEAEARVLGMFSRGATWAIRQRGGILDLETANLAGEGEAGIFVAGGRLTASLVVVRGFDYGIMAGQGALVDGDRLGLQGAKRAGLAIVGAEVEFEDVEVSDIHGEGAFAGIQLIGGRAKLEKLRIHDVSAAGVSQRDGSLHVKDLSIERVAASADGSEGAGVSVRLGTATLLEPIRISEVGGPGVWVAESAEVVAPELSIWKSGWAGVVVETGGRLEVGTLSVREHPAPGLLVTEQSWAKVSAMRVGRRDGGSGLASAGPEMIVANCEEGAQVQLGTLEGATRPRLSCVRPLSEPEASAR